MKKRLTTNEVRVLLDTEKAFEIKDGFLFNDAGKYRPNLSFILPSQFDLNAAGEAVNPLVYVSDSKVADSFNLDFDGSVAFLFGDFWRNQKGTACFRPKDPKQAKHLLVRVDWGGCCNHNRGCQPSYAEEAGALYFRRASSNGGGSGYDYWVLPVGYVRQYESDQAFRVDRKLAAEYCKRHSQLQAEQRAEADGRLWAKKLAEEMSRQARAAIAPQLEVVETGLSELRELVSDVTKITLGEDCFHLGYHNLLYSEENLKKAEEELARETSRVAQVQAERAMRQRHWEDFAPRFNALQSRAEAVDLQIVTDDPYKAVLKKLGRHGGGSHIIESEYSYQGLELCKSKICEREQIAQEEAKKLARQDAEAAAKAAGLPSSIRIWHRSGRTNAGLGWVISANGTERECDRVDTMVCGSNSKKYHQSYEGDHIWNQILPGELVIRWYKECTAAEHDLEVIYRPDNITEAQLEHLVELLEEINEEWDGRTGLASGTASPLIDIAGFLAKLAA